MTARRGALWLVAGIALALLGGRWLASLYGDWAFHHALGSDAVWRSKVVTVALLRVSVFTVTFAFVFANLYAVRQSIVSLVLPRQVGNLEFGEAIPTRRLTILAVGGAALVAFLLMLVDVDWTVARLAFSGLPFAEIDPYLERDLGFYAYVLPFEMILNQLGSAIVLLTVVLVVALYALTPSIRWDQGGLYVSTWVRRHLGVLGSAVILLVAWNWRLDRLFLLTEGNSPTSWVEAPSYFSAYDHRVLMPYLVVLAFAALPMAVVFAWSVWRGHLRVAFGFVTALIVAGPVMRLVLPVVADRDGSAREVAARERPYLATRALYSRRAFGVDEIATQGPAGLSELDSVQVGRFVSTWDPAALVRHVERERRATDVAAFAWSAGAAGLQAVLLRSAPPEAPVGSPWPVDRIEASSAELTGGPTPATGRMDRAIGGVLVAPGAARYAIVADTAGRLAAPGFSTSLERFVHAWDQQNPRLFFADPPALRPRIVVHREVRERLSQIAPFFLIGETITPLANGDSLYWVAELFAVARQYPLAERLTIGGVVAHYVRPAATAIVQAQTGRVTLLVPADPDPITRSWMRLFPDIFSASDAAPAWLRRAIPPAMEWATTQGTILGRTGFFADSVASRALARVDDADADLASGPATLFQLDSTGALAWSVAVVDRGDQITGLLLARGGDAPRTEFHATPSGTRWTATLEQLQAAADTAGFGRTLPHARRGRVQVLPAPNGILFAQAFYVWPPDGPPRLAGVATLQSGRARTGRALATAYGIRDTGGDLVLPADVLRSRIAALYDAMNAALRNGDWRAYGDAWAAIGRLVRRPVP